MAGLRCWNCEDAPPLGLIVDARETTMSGREVRILIWRCARCGHGTIRLGADAERVQTPAQMPLLAVGEPV